MQTVFQHTITRHVIELNDMTLVYRCIECESPDRPKTFSFLITLSEHGCVTDERFIYDITSDKETAEHIFAILTENTVTPFGIEYVLDSVYDIIADE